MRFGDATQVILPAGGIVTNQWAIVEIIFYSIFFYLCQRRFLVSGAITGSNGGPIIIRNHNALASGWDGYIGEIIVADENLSDTNRYLARKYLSQKWAINAVLSEHEVNVVNGTTENIQIPCFSKTQDGTYYLVAYSQGTGEIYDNQAIYVKRIAAAVMKLASNGVRQQGFMEQMQTQDGMMAVAS
jgi:hypothetical protein